MFTDYERAELTLAEYQNNPAKHYRRLVNYYNWTVYEMIDREEMSNTFWYMAVNHKSKEVSIHSEGYDISELPDIIEMLQDFEYYFK
jgi:hypothetical protein